MSLRLLAFALAGALVPVAVIGQEIYDARTLVDRGIASRKAGDYEGAIAALRSAVASDPKATAPRLLLAETLAWAKHFAESEREYRAVMQQDPASHDARLGLARVLLWDGRYVEARSEFAPLARNNDLDAMEGAATAAYWSGDFRKAQREFAEVLRRDSNRAASRQSLAEIESTSRPVDRIGIEAVDDDQPYRTLRAVAATSLFTDPLTRWDAAAGSWWMDASRSGLRANAPFVRIGNETTFPASQLVVAATLGVLRYPDGVSRPIGSAALTRRLFAHSSVSAAIEQYEMLATATAIDRHLSARTVSLQWKRQVDRGLLAAIDARRIQFSDSNRGWAATGYALRPFFTSKRVEFSAGASAAIRDTKDTRFYVESVASQRVAGEYLYTYRGAYTPYWTPRHFREARAIIGADTDVMRLHLRFQADLGVTRDLGTQFGPDSGTALFPPSIYQFEFRRTYHPVHLQLTFSRPVSAGLSLEATIERSSTVFYKANGIRASLVRRR